MHTITSLQVGPDFAHEHEMRKVCTEHGNAQKIGGYLCFAFLFLFESSLDQMYGGSRPVSSLAAIVTVTATETAVVRM